MNVKVCFDMTKVDFGDFKHLYGHRGCFNAEIRELSKTTDIWSFKYDVERLSNGKFDMVVRDEEGRLRHLSFDPKEFKKVGDEYCEGSVVPMLGVTNYSYLKGSDGSCYREESAAWRFVRAISWLKDRKKAGKRRFEKVAVDAKILPPEHLIVHGVKMWIVEFERDPNSNRKMAEKIVEDAEDRLMKDNL